MLDDLFFRVRSLFQWKQAEEELDQELRYHIEQQLEKYVKSGLTRDEAARRVRLEFGGIEQLKEECRDARGIRLPETLIQDVRYALRMLRKSRGFTFVSLLTLALGIGANTAIFSVVYGVLLRPLPYRDPSRLIVLNETTPKVGTVSVSYPNFVDWRAQSRTFSEMAAVHGVDFNLAGISQPETVSGQAVSPNFLRMLGIRPLIGRDFTASEEKAGAAPVVLLNYQLWQSRFGGDPQVIGRTVSLDGRGFTIVGVLPPAFRWFNKTGVLEPIGSWATQQSDFTDRGGRSTLVVIGRLAAGVSFERARAEMEGIAARLARAYPASNEQFGVVLRPIRELFVGDIRPAILVLFGAVMFVLLIACANVATLLLMRGSIRTKEIALRLAIGASRGRVVRQMLVESLVLSFLGGLVGLGLAIGGTRGLSRLIPTDRFSSAAMSVHGPVLLFAAGVVVLSALVFGLTPALHAARADVQSDLKQSGRTSSATSNRNLWRTSLAVAEVSLALVLLTGAGLMLKSLYRLLAVDPGFRPERVLTMELSLRTSQYDKDPAILNFWQQLLGRVRALPGVEGAAVGTVVPLTNDHSRTDITLEGMTLPKPGNFPHPDVHIVSPGYKATLGIELLHGRMFTDRDNEKAPRVAIINALLARRFFPGGDAVGKHLLFGHPSKRQPKWIRIVGVVADTRLYGLSNSPRFEVYVPFQQSVTGDMSLVVKSGNDPAALTSAIRHVVAGIDNDQPIFGVATMQQLVEDSVSTRRTTLVLLGLFSGLALILTAVGIYGVMAHSVAQRTHEIGIRLALGARRADVLRLILSQAAKVACSGIAIGVAGSFGVTRWMANLLFSISAADPGTFAAVAAVVAAVAMLACYIPARRALSVEPMAALRHE